MKKRKLFAVAVFVSAGLLLTGCIYKPTTKECITGYLENIYHNDTKALTKVSDMDKDECQKLHDKYIKEEITALQSALGDDNKMSDKAKKAYKSAVEAAYSKADFTVTDVNQTTEDVYSVTVTCKKANIFKPAMDEFDKAVSKMTAVEAGSMDYNDRVVLLSKQIKQICESDIKYDKEETIKMAVQKNGKEYNFAKKGMANLENRLFDIGSKSTEENIKSITPAYSNSY